MRRHKLGAWHCLTHFTVVVDPQSKPEGVSPGSLVREQLNCSYDTPANSADCEFLEGGDRILLFPFSNVSHSTRYIVGAKEVFVE